MVETWDIPWCEALASCGFRTLNALLHFLCLIRLDAVDWQVTSHGKSNCKLPHGKGSILNACARTAKYRIRRSQSRIRMAPRQSRANELTFSHGFNSIEFHGFRVVRGHTNALDQSSSAVVKHRQLQSSGTSLSFRPSRSPLVPGYLFALNSLFHNATGGGFISGMLNVRSKRVSCNLAEASADIADECRHWYAHPTKLPGLRPSAGIESPASVTTRSTLQNAGCMAGRLGTDLSMVALFQASKFFNEGPSVSIGRPSKKQHQYPRCMLRRIGVVLTVIVTRRKNGENEPNGCCKLGRHERICRALAVPMGKPIALSSSWYKRSHQLP